MINLIVEIFKNQLWAEWMVAFGTIFLALITFIMYLIGDGYTRLTKSKYNYEFKKLAYDFLSISFASWGNKEKIPTSQKISVEEHIDKFYNEILDNKFYLNCCNVRKLKKYVYLAKSAATAWDKAPHDYGCVKKYMKKIAKEMTKLSKLIGKEKDIQKLSENYPWLFEKKCIFRCWFN